MAKRKSFNYQRYLKRLKSKKVEKKGRHMRSRLAAKEVATKRLQAIEAEIAKLQFPKLAEEIIRMHNVPASQKGKILLRQELRAGFLKAFERKGARSSARLKLKEKIALKLAKDSATVYTTLWKYRNKSIPLKEAYEMYKAAAEIMKKAGLELKGDPELKEGFGVEGRNLDRTTEQLKINLSKKNFGSVNPSSREELGKIAEVGETLVDWLYEDLPEFSQVGFQLIDRAVSEAFG